MITSFPTEQIPHSETRKRGPYRKQFERSEELPPFKLQKTDIAIMAAIYDCRVLTFPLLRDLFPPRRENVRDSFQQYVYTNGTPKRPGEHLRKRLNKLFHCGFIKKWPDFMGGEPYYVIDKLGIQVLQDTGRIRTPEPYEWERDVKTMDFLRGNLYHTLMVPRLYVALQVATRQHPTARLEYFERESRNTKIQWQTSQGNTPLSLSRDVFFILSDEIRPSGIVKRVRYPYLVENHRGTMDTSRMYAKNVRYSLLETDRAYEKAFPGLEFFRVLTNVDTSEYNEPITEELHERNKREIEKLRALVTAPQRRLNYKKLKIPRSYKIPAEHHDMFYYVSESKWRNAYPQLLQRICGRGDKAASVGVSLIPNPLGER